MVKSQDTLTGERNAEPIVGATIKAEESTGRILIARVMHGGAADRSGLIAVGDEVGVTMMMMMMMMMTMMMMIRKVSRESDI